MGDVVHPVRVEADYIMKLAGRETMLNRDQTLRTGPNDGDTYAEGPTNGAHTGTRMQAA